MANVFIILRDRDDKKSSDINKRRQIPLQSLYELKAFSSNECDKNLMMVMDLGQKGLIFDRDVIEGEALIDFDKKYRLLKPSEIRNSLTITTSEFQNVLSQTVPCVGCRRSVERLYTTIMSNNYATLDPIRIKNGTLTVCDKYLQSSQLMCTLLYEHDIQLNELLENQPRNKKNSRCNLHSLESFRPFARPFSETFYETWQCMKKNCKEKITVVEALELHATLDDYLKKHKFCQECRTKVEKAFTLLMSESNPTKKEKGYVSAIYSGIKRCLKDKHIHLPTETEYIDDLIKRAEPEIIGSHSRHRERHAKTMEIAQEEVLTCIGMCIYNRLKKLQQCVKEEENACELLAGVAVHALCRSFDVAVENKRGVNLEFIYNEISRDEQRPKKRKINKKRKKQRADKKSKDDQDLCSCDPELVVDKCDSSSDECHNNDYEEMNSDDDDKDKIILCDGTIIDAVDFISPILNTSKMSSLTAEDNHTHNNNNNNHNNNNSDEEKTSCSRSASIENLETKIDTLSMTSCHSCHDDGECAQRSIDAGYSSETQHEVLSSSNNNSSRTSSIASTPEGSEVACSHFCCRVVKENEIESFLTLEQMLDESSDPTDENEVECFIPDSEIIAWKMKFKSRDDIKQKREELREKLLKNFNEMCLKKLSSAK
ncbi:hypothetical protein ACKWTF_006601 [Chironomus riparius]